MVYNILSNIQWTYFTPLHTPLIYFEQRPGFGNDSKFETYNFNMIVNIDLNQTDYYITESFVSASPLDPELEEETAYLEWNDDAYGVLS